MHFKTKTIKLKSCSDNVTYGKTVSSTLRCSQSGHSPTPGRGCSRAPLCKLITGRLSAALFRLAPRIYVRLSFLFFRLLCALMFLFLRSACIVDLRIREPLATYKVVTPTKLRP